MTDAAWLSSNKRIRSLEYFLVCCVYKDMRKTDSPGFFKEDYWLAATRQVRHALFEKGYRYGKRLWPEVKKEIEEYLATQADYDSFNTAPHWSEGREDYDPEKDD